MSATRIARQENARIRALRPPRPTIDATQPIDVQTEKERRADGSLVDTLTVFLAGAECPFTCVFCDLWRHTTVEATRPGAIPRQVRGAIKQIASQRRTWLKLYNASNFFDEHAVPEEDDLEILHLIDKFEKVIVECHPRLVGPRCERWASYLEGRLQVAMGLETIHPGAQPRLNKKASLTDYERAAARLSDYGATWRAFVLIGAPFIAPEESVEWTVRTAQWAAENGAAHVALIPMRGGNGEMERLAADGLFHRPSAVQIEQAFDAAREACKDYECTVTVDLWDVGDFFDCSACRAVRIGRLDSINLDGQDRPPSSSCPQCG